MARPRRLRAAPISLFAFQDIITGVTGVLTLFVLMLALEVVRDSQRDDAPASAAAADLPLRPTHDEARARQTELENAVRDAALRMEASRQAAETWKNLVALPDLMATLDQECEARKKTMDEQRRLSASMEKELLAEEERRQAAARENQRLAAALRDEEVKLKRLKADEKRIVFLPGPASAKQPILLEARGHSVFAMTLTEPRVRWIPGGEDAPAFTEWLRGIDPRKQYFVVLISPRAPMRGMAMVERLQKADFDVGYDPLLPGYVYLPSEARR